MRITLLGGNFEGIRRLPVDLCQVASLTTGALLGELGAGWLIPELQGCLVADDLSFCA